MLLNPFRFSINFLPALTVTPTQLWLYDASIGYNLANGVTLGSEVGFCTDYLATEHGLTCQVFNKSVAGQTMAQIAARFEAEKASITGRADIVINTMPFGNSVSGRWDAKSQAGKDAIIAEVVGFCNSVIANGNTLMLVNTTWRSVTPDSLIDEENGIKPYNEAIVYPIVQGQTNPAMWINGAPFQNDYEFIRRWFSILTDDRHPEAPQGYHCLRSWRLDGFARRVKGLPPLIATRYADPTAFQTRPVQRAMVVFANLTIFAKSSGIYWALTAGSTATGTAKLLQMDGYDPNGMTITLNAAKEGAGTHGTTFNTGDKSKSLTHDGFKANYIFTTSQTFVEAFRVGGLTPGQSVQIDFMGMRQATGDTRRGLYSVDGGTTFVEQNATYAVGQTPSVGTLIGIANGSGEVIFSYRCKVGSTNAYLNGVIITPL